MVISKYNDVKCKPGRRGASFVKGSSGLLLIGALGLSGIADAQSFNFRPYLETGVAAASISESLQVDSERDISANSFDETTEMLYLTLGSEIWSVPNEYSVFAECEIDFFDHYLLTGASLGNVLPKNEILPVFFNLGVKAKQNAHFQPYAYAGVGVAHLKNKFNISGVDEGTGYTSKVELNENANRFAWQIGFGCAYNLTKNFALDVGYTFAYLGQNKGVLHSRTYDGGVEIGENQTPLQIKHKANEFHVGLTYTF